MEQEEIKTDFISLGRNNFRIYITRGEKRFSLVIQCPRTPSRENIIDFFHKNHKNFDIEV